MDFRQNDIYPYTRKIGQQWMVQNTSAYHIGRQDLYRHTTIALNLNKGVVGL